jgi:anti-anti-sigma factor
MAFGFETTRNSGECVVRLFGEFDLAGFEEVDRELHGLQSNREDRVVVDLQGVTFIDSSGLRALLQAWRRSKDEGSEFLLAHPPETVQSLLHLTGLEGRFQFIEG